MAFDVEIAHDRHQQSLSREDTLDQQLALEQRIDLAVALAVDRIVPVIERRTPMVEVADRLDCVIGESIDLVERLPGLLVEANVQWLEPAERAFLRMTVAEVNPAIGDRGLGPNRRRGRPRKARLGRFAETVPGNT